MPYKDPADQQRYFSDWYKRNRERHLENVRRIARERKREVAELIKQAKSKPCADCGMEYPSFVMDFDHGGKEKLFSIADAAKYGYSNQRILAEIEKCDVVCANCHRARTHAPK